MVVSEMSDRRIELILDALDFSVVAGSIRHLRPDRVSSEVREAENNCTVIKRMHRSKPSHVTI